MNIPNYLSLFRILLVAVFVSSLLYYTPAESYFHLLSIGIFLLACLTDALDGWVARRFNQKTVLGSYLDPIADKVLLMSGFLSLTFMHHLPPQTRLPVWVTVPVITRDLLIVMGAILVYVITGGLKSEPLVISKITTFCQMATLFLALVQVPHLIITLFCLATVALTILSGVGYFQMGNRMLQQSGKAL